MKLIFALPLIMAFLSQAADARIRNRKVKEAPKSCKVMSEDAMLSREGKKVLGTLRHSLLIETPAEEETEAQQTISLVKDKGEKICQWTELQWKEILQNNKIENLSNFSFYVDEYKEVLYPFAKNADNSFFVMSIPFNSCEFATQSTKESLDLPKCEIPRKKAKRKKSKKNSIARK